MSDRKPVEVVWLKRDLRLRDHEALWRAVDAAAQSGGRVLCVYFYEPELIRSAEFDGSHLVFINECLAEVEEGLRARGGELVTRVSDLPKGFEELFAELPFGRVWSHEETGQAVTYARDLRVGEWCRERGVEWRECCQTGVVRRLKTRDGWSKRWQERMAQPVLSAPKGLRGVGDLVQSAGLLGAESFADLGLQASSKKGAQGGGETEGREVLRSFLRVRGQHYRKEMSSPVTAVESCSRVSPHLTWGSLSVKTVMRAAAMRAKQLRELRTEGEKIPSGYLGSLASFQGRLRWHCHFMQKLEDEPEIEFHNFLRVFDGMREDFTDSDVGRGRFEAWRLGETGYPLVDACMRCLHETGWINFRMRAMLVSFASYHLWLHWRKTAVHLAADFLDFEPGIHYSQFQMQSGTTGINTLRIYNPIKQQEDQDPQGVFVKKWCPELAQVPTEYLTQPWMLSPAMQLKCGVIIGKDYPLPVVEHRAAVREARGKLAEFRKRPEFRAEAARVLAKHGSRKGARKKKGGAVKKGAGKKPEKEGDQGEFSF